MAEQKVIDYIQQQRALGVADANIKTTAVRGGFTAEEVNEAFAAVGESQHAQPAAAPAAAAAVIAPPSFAVTPPGSIVPPMARASADTSAGFVYAGFWRRAVAIALDTLILVIISFIVLILATVIAAYQSSTITSALGGPLTPADLTTVISPVILIAVLIISVVTFFYYPLLESSSWQATIGKRLMGLRVVDESGARISFLRALARYLSKILSAVFLIGYIMAAFTSKKQALHDLIAGTLVIKQAPASRVLVTLMLIIFAGAPVALHAYFAQQTSQARANLEDSVRVSDLREIETSLALYQASNAGTYPPQLGLLISAPDSLGIDQATIADPVSRAPYQYSTSADARSYVLCATLNKPPTIPIQDGTYSNGEYCVRSGADAGTIQVGSVAQSATPSQATAGSVTTSGSQTQPQTDADTGNRPLANMQIQGTATAASVSVIAAPTYFTDAQPQATDYHSLSDWQPVGPVQVVNGAWSAQIPDLMGTYEIFLFNSATYQLLATSTVTLSISPLWGPPSATIDQSSLMTTSRTPVITGTATHISAIRVAVGDTFYDPPVKDGKWSTYSPTTLVPGSYKVVVQDLITQKTLATGTLMVQ